MNEAASEKEVVKAGGRDISLLTAVKISLDHVREMLSQLAFMIQSGIPLFTSLGLVAENMHKIEMRQILEQIRFDLAEGMSLSTALKRYPYVFNSVQTSMIMIGESSGRMDEALGDLVKMIDDQRDLRDEIRKVMAYPLFMIFLSIFLTLGMLLFIFPRFQGIFQGFNVELPIITVFFMSISGYLLDHILYVFIAIGLIPLTIFLVMNISSLRFVWDRYRYRIPLFGGLFQGQTLAQFGRVMGSLLSTGVPLVESLSLYKDTVKNLFLRDRMERIIAMVREGAPLSTALSTCELFSPLSIQLVRTGENTGEIDKMVQNMFAFYRKRLSAQIKRLVMVLEPTFLAFMGGMVALMALSVLLPLFKLAGSVRGR